VTPRIQGDRPSGAQGGPLRPAWPDWATAGAGRSGDGQEVPGRPREHVCGGERPAPHRWHSGRVGATDHRAHPLSGDLRPADPPARTVRSARILAHVPDAPHPRPVGHGWAHGDRRPAQARAATGEEGHDCRRRGGARLGAGRARGRRTGCPSKGRTAQAQEKSDADRGRRRQWSGSAVWPQGASRRCWVISRSAVVRRRSAPRWGAITNSSRSMGRLAAPSSSARRRMAGARRASIASPPILRHAFPGHERVLAAEPPLHARMRHGVSPPGLVAARCCQRALGPREAAA